MQLLPEDLKARFTAKRKYRLKLGVDLTSHFLRELGASVQNMPILDVEVIVAESDGDKSHKQ